MRSSLILWSSLLMLMTGVASQADNAGGQAPAPPSDYHVFKLPALVEAALRAPDREERLGALVRVAEAHTATPIRIGPDLRAAVTPGNTVWNAQAGLFSSMLEAPEHPVDREEMSKAYRGAASQFLRPLLADGRAAGNLGDVYDNRDNGHSQLSIDRYPGLAQVHYSPEAMEQNVHTGLARLVFPLPTIGNCSMAQTAGPAWRSLPRFAYIDSPGVNRMALLYFFNQMHVYPEHKDHDSEFGDLYPANTPYIVISQGSSRSDQPFLRALFSTLAAFQPETKQHLIANRQLMPTVQMLLRSKLKGSEEPDAYFTGQCHPVVFNPERMDVDAMVRRAQTMRPSDLVPTPTLRVVAESPATPGLDYFDTVVETLFDSPCSIARIFRTLSYTRSITVSASPVIPAPEGASWRWAVLQGDPGKVRIIPETSDRSRVRIDVDWHDDIRSSVDPSLPSTRVDVGCFLTMPDGRVSAPAFVTVAFLRDEIRRYSEDADRRLLSVDYTVPPPYVDPLLTARRDWRDEYHYGPDGRRSGWTRHRGGETERFTHDGMLIESTDAQGRPLRVLPVTYRRDPSSTSGAMPTLVQETAR